MWLVVARPASGIFALLCWPGAYQLLITTTDEDFSKHCLWGTPATPSTRPGSGPGCCMLPFFLMGWRFLVTHGRRSLVEPSCPWCPTCVLSLRYLHPAPAMGFRPHLGESSRGTPEQQGRLGASFPSGQIDWIIQSVEVLNRAGRLVRRIFLPHSLSFT